MPEGGYIDAGSDQGLAAGETGTVYFESPGAFAYHNDPDKTRASRDPKGRGWSTLGDVGTRMGVVIVCHSPDELPDVSLFLDRSPLAVPPLYLCGHTHAGQIRLPNGKVVFTQLVRCRHTVSGLWHEGKMVGHTSPGLGVSPPTVRFNTRGGAAVITLRRAA